MKNTILVFCLAALSLTSCGQEGNFKLNTMDGKKINIPASEEKREVVKSEEEWKKELTPMQFEVTCGGATEPAFTGEYWDHHDTGMYKCVRCGEPLFNSDTKFESGSGWPSFYAPAANENVAEKVDSSYGMMRTEVVCHKCGAHLGHLFDDGPKPTGMRYCINSAALKFDKEKKTK